MKTLYTDQAYCVIELLSGSLPEKGRRVPGSFRTFQSQQLIATINEPLSITHAVTVQHEDVLFIGEVIACTPKTEKDWELLIKVHQILNSLQSLTILRERLLWRDDQSRLIPIMTPSVLVRV